MPRPCVCDAPACPLCVTWHQHPNSPAAKAWRGETVTAIRAAQAPAPAAVSAWLAAGPCAYRASPTGETRDCQTCAGRVPVPVIRCHRHGECHASAGKFLYGVPCCQTCPDQAAAIVPGLIDPLPGPWRQPGRWCEDAAEAARHATALRHLAAAPLPDAPPMSGEGVVTCGGGKYWPGVVVMVRMLRECGSALPVQVWYRGSCEAVNPADVAGLGVELVDADAHAAARGGTRVPRGRVNLGGWGAKLYALAHTRFKTCVFIDADAYFTSDPERLLALGRRHGFACWTENGIDNVRWPKIGYPAGKPADACPTIQGGQFAIDRARCWRELLIAHWVCQHEDFYWPAKAAAPHEAGRPLFGDQDAWRVAMTATRFKPHVIGAAEFRAGWGYLFWLDGVTAVEHRCFSKLIPVGTVGEARALMHFARHIGADDPPGWFRPEEAALLQEFARGRFVLEFGRFHGRSTAAAASVARGVWSVDRLPAGPARSHLDRAGLLGRVTLVEGDYTDPATHPPPELGPPQVVLVDGEHHRAAVLRDLDLAARLVAEGGVILVHDHGMKNAPDVAPAADAWARANGWKMTAKAGTLAVFARSV